jgi:hypothetical protein
MRLQIHSFDGFKQYVSQMPLCDPELYHDDYIEIVAKALRDLCKEKGFVYGNEMPELTDSEFWDCMACAEKEEV